MALNDKGGTSIVLPRLTVVQLPHSGLFANRGLANGLWDCSQPADRRKVPITVGALQRRPPHFQQLQSLHAQQEVAGETATSRTIAGFSWFPTLCKRERILFFISFADLQHESEALGALRGARQLHPGRLQGHPRPYGQTHPAGHGQTDAARHRQADAAHHEEEKEGERISGQQHSVQVEGRGFLIHVGKNSCWFSLVCLVKIYTQQRIQGNKNYVIKTF